MDRIDAVVDRLMRRRQRNRLSFPVNFAARADVNPRQHLDEGRFTCSVLSDDRVDFARLKFEIHRLQGVCGPEALVELLKNEERLTLLDCRATLLRLVH